MLKSHRSYRRRGLGRPSEIETPLAPDLVARDFAAPAGSTVGFEHHIRPDRGVERLTSSRGRMVITASGPNEVALEAAELVTASSPTICSRGFRNRDRNGDGIVTVVDLYESVEDQGARRSAPPAASRVGR